MRVISGIARNTKLAALPGEDVTRPTIERVKEGMFSAVQFMIAGAKVLDLCAGSGQLGIEALSRGAEKCVFIDQNRDAVTVIQQNLKAAGLFNSASVAQTSAEGYLASCRETFDLILCDPPYRQNAAAMLLPLIAKVAAPGANILFEAEAHADLPEKCDGLTLQKQYQYGAVLVGRYENTVEF
ncbi:MAG: 16S rRNA (guanine(966)-N(2))-methyltransferase RsmD [Ruthenibacterium sp.]